MGVRIYAVARDLSKGQQVYPVRSEDFGPERAQELYQNHDFLALSYYDEHRCRGRYEVQSTSSGKCFEVLGKPSEDIFERHPRLAMAVAEHNPNAVVVCMLAFGQ